MIDGLEGGGRARRVQYFVQFTLNGFLLDLINRERLSISVHHALGVELVTLHAPFVIFIVRHHTDLFLHNKDSF